MKTNDIKKKIDQSSTLADKLNQLINRLSPAKRKATFLVMGISIAMVSLNLVVKSVRTEETIPSLKPEKIAQPIDIRPNPPVQEQQSEQDIIKAYNRMMRFKELVDRLKVSGNRQSLDSLMNTYPGLRDSLTTFLENYYSN